MAAPRGRRVEEEEKVEEVGVLAVYQKMLELLEEMYKAALSLESGESVATLLGSLNLVRMQINESVEKVLMEKQMEEDIRRHEEEVESGNS